MFDSLDFYRLFPCSKSHIFDFILIIQCGQIYLQNKKSENGPFNPENARKTHAVQSKSRARVHSRPLVVHLTREKFHFSSFWTRWLQRNAHFNLITHSVAYGMATREVFPAHYTYTHTYTPQSLRLSTYAHNHAQLRAPIAPKWNWNTELSLETPVAGTNFARLLPLLIFYENNKK